jgi:hypothetical protein
VQNNHRFAIVITHNGKDGRVVDMPWLEQDCHVDASDWIVLSDDGWRAAAGGDASIWEALERKLLIGFYASQPELVLVVGHPSGRRAAGAGQAGEGDAGKQEVARVVRRLRSLQLPAYVAGFWTGRNGLPQAVVDPAAPAESEADWEPACRLDGSRFPGRS